MDESDKSLHLTDEDTTRTDRTSDSDSEDDLFFECNDEVVTPSPTTSQISSILIWYLRALDCYRIFFEEI